MELSSTALSFWFQHSPVCSEASSYGIDVDTAEVSVIVDSVGAKAATTIALDAKDIAVGIGFVDREFGGTKDGEVLCLILSRGDQIHEDSTSLGDKASESLSRVGIGPLFVISGSSGEVLSTHGRGQW
jgi:hypothetical protein